MWNHPVDDLRVIETHISWVLLTGPYAYKIKKPVDFGFVNFTSLQRRRFFCEEELRLNRQLAPELYLAVVPIVGSVERPRPNGPGEPIELAVKMRQFPQEMLLSRVLDRGALTRPHVNHLAMVVAEFHQTIDVASSADGFGTPDVIFQPVAENFQHLILAGDSESRRPLVSAQHRMTWAVKCGSVSVGSSTVISIWPKAIQRRDSR